MDVIVDIDGTLADASHRLHWISSRPKNWKAFFANMDKDLPIVETVSLVQSLADAGHRLIYCSGRPADYRDVTVEWLRLQVGRYGPLFMRAKGDFRNDDVVKEELLAEIRLQGFDPVLALDDRKRVVDMWRRNGIRCLAVEEGEF
jgi:uncharacterized HAD superfamily protein